MILHANHAPFSRTKSPFNAKTHFHALKVLTMAIFLVWHKTCEITRVVSEGSIIIDTIDP